MAGRAGGLLFTRFPGFQDQFEGIRFGGGSVCQAAAVPKPVENVICRAVLHLGFVDVKGWSWLAESKQIYICTYTHEKWLLVYGIST